MDRFSLSFIGAGNMATSLVGGLVADGFPAQRISVADIDDAAVDRLVGQHGVRAAGDNVAAVRGADVVVLAVKPQVLRDVAREIAPAVAEQRPLILSIAAGIRMADLERWLGDGVALVRAMPNTPALVQSGVAALVANERVSPQQREAAESILRAVGIALWLDDEALLDAVTAVSGSGPAYFFLLIELLQEAAHSLGLPADTGRILALQTAFGASKMALESSEDAATLRQRVTSPGGTTERALAVLEEGGLRELFLRALRAARDRSRELSERLGAD